MIRFSTALLILACIPATAQDFTLDRGVIASGGGDAAGGAFTLDGTIAQPAVGRATGGDFVLDAGFWMPELSVPSEEVLFSNGFES